jgi:hypothetical protein
VDFEGLRAKYAPGGPGNPNPAPPVPAAVSPEESAAAAHLSEKLDSIRACGTCMGSGMERYTYHMQQRERTCATCDGEGIIDLRPVGEPQLRLAPATATFTVEMPQLPAAPTTALRMAGVAVQEEETDEPPPVLF